MGAKLLRDFMVTRRFAAVAAVFLVAAFASSACDSEPLFAPTDSDIILFADSASVPAFGSTRIVARVIEPAGTPPHKGTQIVFLTTLGAVQPQTAETDENGYAITFFQAGATAGSATVKASSGGVTADDLTLTIVAAQ